MPEALLGFVGDVFVNRDDPAEVFNEVKDVLATPDLMFGNLEGPHTDDPHPTPGAIGCGGAPAHCLSAYGNAGFDVLSLANNHILDVGYAAMLETRDRVRDMGVQTCGVGDHLADARRPALLTTGDELKVAYLAYASVFPLGYEARSRTPGLAPMRAYNFYRDPYPSIHVPGKRSDVVSVPDEKDLAMLEEDIRLAKEQADIVVTSFHWGDTTRPYHLTDHETRTARHAIDHGADIVVGHHHHALRGMEWYRGKPIMYGLGHFVFDLRMDLSEEAQQDIFDELPLAESADTPYIVRSRPGWPYLPMHPDTRMTLLAWARVDRGRVRDIGFLPCRLTADGHVHPLRLGSTESDEVLDYLRRCNVSQGLDVAFEPAGEVSLGGFETLRVTPGSGT